MVIYLLINHDLISYPGFGGGVDDEKEDVHDLYKAAKGVDGDEQNGVGFELGIVEPQHATE